MDKDKQQQNPFAAKSQASSGITSKSSPLIRKKILTVVIVVVVGMLSGISGAAIYSVLAGKGNTTINTTSVTSTESQAIEAAVKKISPSVVSIVASGTSTEVRSSADDGWFFGNDNQQSYETQSAGTGVIISRDGYIITNKHILSDNVTSVSVVLTDGTEYENVSVVGRDPLNDIAFLKIPNVNNLTPAELGDSTSLAVGTKVIAIGNALGEYQNSVTSGIVSATGRTITASIDDDTTETLTNLFQTDAAINAGNSGGPLVTLDGKVVGINTAIVEDAQGIGFSIPISEASGVITSVLQDGKVERAYLGVNHITLNKSIAKKYNLPVSEGAYVHNDRGSAIISGSPADEAGIKDGDIITKIDDQELNSSALLTSIISTKQPNDEVTITILRNEKLIILTVKLAEYTE